MFFVVKPLNQVPRNWEEVGLKFGLKKIPFLYREIEKCDVVIEGILKRTKEQSMVGNINS